MHLKIQKKCSKKNLDRKLSTRKTLKNPFQKNICREISTKEISEETSPPRKYSIWREFSTKKKRKSDKKIRYYLPKKFCRKILAFFSREISTKQNLKRYLYVKIREEKSLPKDVWRDISTKKSQETSPAKNLRREISSKESLKKKIHEISKKKSLPKQPSRDSSKISLKRNLYQTSIWEVFFTRNCLKEYCTERTSGDFLPNYIPVKKDYQKTYQKLSPQNIWRWISTQKTFPEKTLKKSFYNKSSNTNINPKICEETSLPKKIWKGISTRKNHPDGNSLPKKPEDKSLPKKIWRNDSTKKIWEGISTKNYLERKSLQNHEDKSLPNKNSEEKSLPSSLPK